MEELLHDSHTYAKGVFVIKESEDCFDQPENPLSLLNTEPKSLKHLEENQKRFEALEYFAGVGFDMRRD